MSDLYVIKVPVVSTVHLTPATYEHLAFDVDCGAHAGAISADRDSLWVYVDTEEHPDCVPDLKELFRWARDYGYDYIRLDGEIGAVVPDLPSYAKEWEAVER